MSGPRHRIHDLARPRLPVPLRIANAAGGRVARAAVSLEESSLCAAATRRAGCDDFGDDGFREPLGVLLGSIANDPRLSALGRVGTRQFFIQLLTNRLLIEQLHRQHPEIGELVVERPIVIAGLPRTGTTHLHSLVSQAPELRSLPYWESLEPVPLPGETGPDARIGRCEKALSLLDWAMPHFRRMHEMTAQGPHEEVQLLAIDFRTMLLEASYDIPAYRDWYMSNDQTGSYRFLRRTLQALQWLRGGTRWILKSPQHLEQLGPLMAAFPDAKVIQTHRDPVRITASLSTMIAYGRRMNYATLDPAAVGRYWAARVEDMLRGSIEGRRFVPEGQLMDVRFHEFMKDELAMTRRVFEFADEPLEEAAAAALRRFIDANPRGRHGAIDYRLEDVGLDIGERREALRFYQERFDLPDE